jgi:AcrR family transcriptional regulator
MTDLNTDPRILRTRKLIMDSFVDLSAKKEFKDITIKDITREANINRSTFYYHFEDIFDLLDKALTEVFFINISTLEYEKETITEDTLVRIFQAITNFQDALSHRCHRGYEDTIARIIREQLQVIFKKMLENQYGTSNPTGLKRTASFLSWGMYGLSSDWRNRMDESDSEAFISEVIPFLLEKVAI